MDDLISTNMRIISFMGDASNALGVLMADVVARLKKVKSTFFGIDDKYSYLVIFDIDGTLL